MAPQPGLAAAATTSSAATASPGPGDYNNCLCFEVTLRRCDGTREMKRFMATRDVEFPELRERLVATFPGDLRVRRKERGGEAVIKSNFEIAYVGRLCRLCNTYVMPSRDLIVFDTFGLRAALLNDYKSNSEADSDELLVVKIICTVRDSKCTIL